MLHGSTSIEKIQAEFWLSDQILIDIKMDIGGAKLSIKNKKVLE